MEPDEVFAIKLPDGEVVQIRDLPPRILQEIGDRHSVSWMVVLDAPTNNVGVALDLLQAVAALNGVSFPEPLRTRDLITLMANWFVLVEKDESEDDDAPIAWSV